jgi:hypothetical protein
MKKFSFYLIFLTLIFSLMLLSNSCKHKDNEPIDDDDLESILEKGEKINKNIDNAEQQLEKRKKSGDTIALDWQQLGNFIPDIPGYVRGEANGMNLKLDNLTYSNLSIQFTKGDNTIDIDVFDYNMAISLLTGVTGWRALEHSIDNKSLFMQVSKFPDIANSWIYEELNKDSQIATCALSLNDRYFVSVNATSQVNTDFVKSIAKLIVAKGLNTFKK